MHETPYLKALTRLESSFEVLRHSTHRPHPAYFQANLHAFLGWELNVLNEVDDFKTKPSYSDPFTQVGEVDMLLRDPATLPNKPRFLVWDCMLNLELAKAMYVFRWLDLAEQAIYFRKKAQNIRVLLQEVHLKHVILPATLLSEAYYAHKMEPGVFIMPDGGMPYNINIGQTILANLPMYLRQVKCHKEIMDSFVGLDPSREEMVLLRAAIFYHSGAPGLSVYARQMLLSSFEHIEEELKKHISNRLGPGAAGKRMESLVKLAVQMFELAQDLRLLLIDFHLKFGNRKYKFPIFETIIRID
uniref:NR LBD domain-containing protein n=1 Tax=Ditylenchus dipsaci TaxID=166011 RepID=A0A915EG66_9BILA